MVFKALDQAEKGGGGGGGGGDGPPEGKFTRLGGKVNSGMLSSKINVIRANKGTISLILMNKSSFFMLKAIFSDSTNVSAGIQMKNDFTHHI